MRGAAALLLVLVVGATGCKGGCGKTPVPFKRGASNAAADAGAPLPTEGTAYEEPTKTIKVGSNEFERKDGSFRASLEWELTGDDATDAVVIATDQDARASFETWTRPDSEKAAALRSSVALLATQPGCIVEQAALSRLAPDLVLAKLDVSCAGDAIPPETPPPAATSTAAPGAAPSATPGATSTPTPTAATATAPAAASAPMPTGAGTPTPTTAAPASGSQANTLDLPPEPGTRARALHQFILAAEATPRVLLHFAALPATDPSDTTRLDLSVSSQDQDADQHGDLLVTANIGSESIQASSVPLVWLNRPSGFARDRNEPERTLGSLIEPAFKTAAKDPVAALPAALTVLATHRLLCHESGVARLWVDESAGLACGPSIAAGRAAVIRVLALAKQQQLLAALEARAQLDDPGFKIEASERERVRLAVATIRGQTNYVWERGPDFTPANGPSVHLPALGFATEDQLLVRGSIPLVYDVYKRIQGPSAFAQGVTLTAPAGQVAIVDLVRDCAGRYLRLVPASSIVSGFVAAGRGMDVPLASERPVAEGCTGGVRRSDRSSWTVLGWTSQGALLAQGSTLQLVPIDPEGKSAGPARVLGPTEPAPPLLVPGALSQNGLRYALATSEGVAVVERGPTPSTTLIRSPASCTGRVADVAILPSGKRVAMSCSGHSYWAHETVPAATAAPATPVPAAHP
jgi:hypothetical protein